MTKRRDSHPTVVPMVRKDVLPHAVLRPDGSVWLTYDHGKTWTPCPRGSIALNPLPMMPEVTHAEI